MADHGCPCPNNRGPDPNTRADACLCSPDFEPDRQQQIQTESLSRTQKWMDCPQVDPHRASQPALRLFRTEGSRVENSPSPRWAAAAEPVAQPRAQNMQTVCIAQPPRNPVDWLPTRRRLRPSMTRSARQTPVRPLPFACGHSGLSCPFPAPFDLDCRPGPLGRPRNVPAPHTEANGHSARPGRLPVPPQAQTSSPSGPRSKTKEPSGAGRPWIFIYGICHQLGTHNRDPRRALYRSGGASSFTEFGEAQRRRRPLSRAVSVIMAWDAIPDSNRLTLPTLTP